MAKTLHTPSRRAMLAGLAAAPVAGLPSIAGAEATDDPIFALIERYERAHAAFTDSDEGPYQDAVYRVYTDAEVAMHSTEPATRAGAVRLLRAIAEFLDDDVINDTVVGNMIGDSIRRAAVVLEREAWS